MEFVLLWLFVSIEKIALLFSTGGTLFKVSLVVWIGSYVISALLSKNQEHLDSLIVKSKRLRKWCVGLAFVGASVWSVSVVMPDRKELAIIIGAGTTYNVLTSEPAKEIGGKALQLLQKKMDEALQEPIQPGNKENESA